MTDDLRALDREVAKMFGYQGVRFDEHGLLGCDVICDGGTYQGGIVPRFSTHPAACALVKKRLRDARIDHSIAFGADAADDEELHRMAFCVTKPIGGMSDFWAWGATEEEAVCRFALACSERGLL